MSVVKLIAWEDVDLPSWVAWKNRLDIGIRKLFKMIGSCSRAQRWIRCSFKILSKLVLIP